MTVSDSGDDRAMIDDRNLFSTRYKNAWEVLIILGILIVCGMPLLLVGLQFCKLQGCNDEIPTIAAMVIVIGSQYWVLRQWRMRPRAVLTVTAIALTMDVLLWSAKAFGAL